MSKVTLIVSVTLDLSHSKYRPQYTLSDTFVLVHFVSLGAHRAAPSNVPLRRARLKHTALFSACHNSNLNGLYLR